jgi:Ca2+-binding RTX toxin-like protein
MAEEPEEPDEPGEPGEPGAPVDDPETHFPVVFNTPKGGLYGGFFNGATVADPNVAAIIMDYRWATTSLGTEPATTIKYAFPQSKSDYNIFPSPNIVDPVSNVPINDIQKAAVLTTFGLISSYTKLSFVEAPSGSATDATVRFAQAIGGDSHARFPSNQGAWTGYRSDSRDAGDNFLGGNGNPVAQYFGTDEFNTIMHEFGHSIGLKHGHDPSIHGALAASRNDNEFSVMTYASYLGSNVDDGPTIAVEGSSPRSFMMYDIAALQVLYGANWDKVGSGETYTWDAGTGQQSINGKAAPFTGTTAGNKIFSTVWTQGAAATYDLHNFGQDQVDDLRPGHWLTFSNNQLADLNRAEPDNLDFRAQGNVYNALLYQNDLRSAIADLITGIGNDTLIGNDRDNKLTGGAGTDILVANGGNDTLSGGPGADKIYFGPGSDVVRDNLGSLNGDTMFDFGFHASVDIVGARIGRDSVSITPTTATVSAGGSTFQLNGDFAGGGNAGGLIIAARGSGDSAHTTLSHVNFLPDLREGVGVNPATVNGVADQTYLSGDGTVAFTVEMKSAVSSFANTLGYYKVGADGKISDVHILFGNTLGTASGTTVNLGTPGNGELWKARCAGYAAPGTPVVVMGLDGLTLEVEPG